MTFITPLITTIQNVSSDWYYSVCKDERYKSLMTTLDIPAPTATANMCWIKEYNLRGCTALITWGDINKVYQHSDTVLLYFLLMEILYITGALVQMILLDMYLLLQTLKKRYLITLMKHRLLIYILYLFLTLYY